MLANGEATSVRLLTKADRIGFSLSIVTLNKSLAFDLWYKNHWETNYIVSGSGELTDKESRQCWGLNDGTIYCVGPRDRHQLKANTNLKIVSIFCPAVYGNEVHDEDGSYPKTGDIPIGPEKMFVRTPTKTHGNSEGTSSPANQLLTFPLVEKEDHLSILLNKLLLPAGEKIVVSDKSPNVAIYILVGEGILKIPHTNQEYTLLPGILWHTTDGEQYTITAKIPLTYLAIFNTQP